MPSIFLSHSSRDKAIARRLALDFKMSNMEVWLDEWEIKVGHSIVQKINRGLDDTDFIAVLLSTNSVESGWVEKEWSSRIGDEARTMSVCVLPIMIEECSIPRLLQDKKYADLRNNYAQGLRDLLDAVRYHAASDKPVTAGAQIHYGRIVFTRTVPDLPVFRGLINTIEAGCFERFEDGLRAQVKTVASHQAIQEINEKTGADMIELFSSDHSISVDEEKASVFKGNQRFCIPAGDVITNISSGSRQRLAFPISGNSETTVNCSTNNGVIAGSFSQSNRYDPPAQLGEIQVYGTFNAVIKL